MLLRSLKDRDLVELVFNWQYYYYYVKNEGVTHLREYLGILEDNIAPITFKNTRKAFVGRDEEEEGEDRPRRRFGGGRGGRGGRFGGRGGDRGMGIGRGGAPKEDVPAEEAPAGGEEEA
jgi:small subunit ribosomal protein S10e